MKYKNKYWDILIHAKIRFKLNKMKNFKIHIKIEKSWIRSPLKNIELLFIHAKFYSPIKNTTILHINTRVTPDIRYGRVAFLLFLAPAGDSNPAVPIL